MHPIPSDKGHCIPAYDAYALRYRVLYKVLDDLHASPVRMDKEIPPAHKTLALNNRQ